MRAEKKIRRFTMLLLFFIGAAEISAQTSVHIDYFEHKIADDKVKFVWEVSNQKNVKQYNLYRSIDNSNFYLVGEFPVHGNPAHANYTHYDPTVSGGINYYRLEAIGTDESKTELARTSVEMVDLEKIIRVYPNVENGTIHIKSGEQITDMEMELMDMLGRTYPLSFVRDSSHELTAITGPIQKGAYILVCHMNKVRWARVKTFFT